MVTLMCRTCRTEKPCAEFSPSKASRSGFRGECKACGVVRARAWNIANADKCREAGRRRYAENPDKKRSAAKKWADSNQERGRENRAKWYAANAEKVREKTKKWALANPERYREICRKSGKKWADANPDKVLEKGRRQYITGREERIEKARLRYAENPERVLEVNRKWAKANPEKLRANERNRKAAKMKRRPPWYGEFDHFVIESAYALAKLREAATGIEWHVDHMIPLRAKKASGLHVGLNVQVIPEAMNLFKRNKMLYLNPGEWVKAI